MPELEFANPLIEFIFWQLLSEHSRANIHNHLLYFPTTGVSYRQTPLFRKRGIYNRKLIIYYKLDHLTHPQTIVIIGYRFGYMKNVISVDNDKNWRTVLGILRDYPEDSVREKIY